MFARPFTITPSPRRRRLVGWLSLMVYFAATFGLPMPALPATGPFPCQAHGCGCRSAEQCWRSCCCFSMEEKLAWARDNGVEPPSYVVEAVAEKSCCSSHRKAKSEPAKKASHRSCCSAQADHACEAAVTVEMASKAASCCSAPQTQPEKHVADSSRRGVQWVPAINAFRCQGLGSAWMAIVDVIAPPPAVLEYHIALPYCGHLNISGDVLVSVAYAPATPPG